MMATNRRKIDREQIRSLLEKGVKYDDIASMVGCSPRTVATAAKELNFHRPRGDHKAALPWVLIGLDHQRAAPAQNMRELSRIIQGDKTLNPHKRATAITWAQDLVRRGLDVAYDPEMEPNDFSPAGGFYTVDASGKIATDTHIGRLLADAMEAWKS
ncbi:helix-turn-helix domain-containing protein [Streptosporangium sp. OZ121]|uniref:helix-turn-helix domain-containing protein n=1 Tax=Streptosporangium sp. OZ121 TaxID=3444183 RepID=UPI003F795923